MGRPVYQSDQCFKSAQGDSPFLFSPHILPGERPDALVNMRVKLKTSMPTGFHYSNVPVARQPASFKNCPPSPALLLYSECFVGKDEELGQQWE